MREKVKTAKEGRAGWTQSYRDLSSAAEETSIICRKGGEGQTIGDFRKSEDNVSGLSRGLLINPLRALLCRGREPHIAAVCPSS